MIGRRRRAQVNDAEQVSDSSLTVAGDRGVRGRARAARPAVRGSL